MSWYWSPSVHHCFFYRKRYFQHWYNCGCVIIFYYYILTLMIIDNFIALSVCDLQSTTSLTRWSRCWRRSWWWSTSTRTRGLWSACLTSTASTRPPSPAPSTSATSRTNCGRKSSTLGRVRTRDSHYGWAKQFLDIVYWFRSLYSYWAIALMVPVTAWECQNGTSYCWWEWRHSNHLIHCRSGIDTQ